MQQCRAAVPCSSASSSAVKVEALLVCVCSWLSFSFHSTDVMDAQLHDNAGPLNGTCNIDTDMYLQCTVKFCCRTIEMVRSFHFLLTTKLFSQLLYVLQQTGHDSERGRSIAFACCGHPVTIQPLLLLKDGFKACDLIQCWHYVLATPDASQKGSFSLALSEL